MFYFIFQISVLAKVVKEKTSAVQDVRGKLMNRKDIIIADSTASIKLALWDALVNQIQLEKSYLFKNVATRSYFNEKYITTTPATVVEETGQLENVVPVTDEEADNTISKCGRISQLRIQVVATCQCCKKKVTAESDEIFTRCPNCQMKLKAKNLTPTLHASVIFNSDDKIYKLVAFHAILSHFCTILGKEEFKTNTDLFEEYLLEKENVELAFDNNVITKITVKD
jgi:hypothetical protein